MSNFSDSIWTKHDEQEFIEILLYFVLKMEIAILLLCCYPPIVYIFRYGFESYDKYWHFVYVFCECIRAHFNKLNVRCKYRIYLFIYWMSLLKIFTLRWFLNLFKLCDCNKHIYLYMCVNFFSQCIPLL